MKFDGSMTEYNEIVGASIHRLLGGGEAEKLHKENTAIVKNEKGQKIWTKPIGRA